MRRMPRNNDIGKSLEEWKHSSWDVTLHLNGRQSVTSIHVTSHYRPPDEDPEIGHASGAVQPFDDLRTFIQELCTEALIHGSMPERGQDQRLPFEYEK